MRLYTCAFRLGYGCPLGSWRCLHMNEGMDDYTTKPLQVDQIKALIGEYTEDKQK